MKCCCLLQKRTANNNKMRIVPVIEVYNISSEELNRFESLGVRFSIINNKKLRIQGIKNCLIVSPFINNSWFKDAMKINSYWTSCSCGLHLYGAQSVRRCLGLVVLHPA